MVSPKNTHTSNTQTEQAVLTYVGLYIHTYTHTFVV